MNIGDYVRVTTDLSGTRGWTGMVVGIADRADIRWVKFPEMLPPMQFHVNELEGVSEQDYWTYIAAFELTRSGP